VKRANKEEFTLRLVLFVEDRDVGSSIRVIDEFTVSRARTPAG
jgi:hypothetical protein